MRTIKHLLVAATLICTSTFAAADEVIGGSVTSVSADSITIKGEKGEKTLSLSSDTQVLGNAAALSEVVVGASVAVRCNAEGTSAAVIRVLPPPDEILMGALVSISDTSITLKTEKGDQTFAITPETEKKNYTAITEIKVGSIVAIRIKADKKNATLINAKPPQ